MSAPCAPPAEAGRAGPATPSAGRGAGAAGRVDAGRVDVRLIPDPPPGGGGPDPRDLAVLDADERARARAFADPRLARSWAHAHAAARRLLGDRLGVAAADVAWRHLPCAGCGGPHGKPFLPPGTGVHFSLAHTVGLAVLAVHDRPVGVDVERADALGGAVLDRALHPAERDLLAGLPPDHRGAAFLHCWVRKEAVLKATGTGLAREPDTLEVGPGPWFGHPAWAPGGWTVQPFEASRREAVGTSVSDSRATFVGAVAVRSAARAAVVVRWSEGCDGSSGPPA